MRCDIRCWRRRCGAGARPRRQMVGQRREISSNIIFCRVIQSTSSDDFLTVTLLRRIPLSVGKLAYGAVGITGNGPQNRGVRYATSDRPRRQRRLRTAASFSQGTGLHASVLPAKRQQAPLLQVLPWRRQRLHALAERFLRQHQLPELRGPLVVAALGGIRHRYLVGCACRRSVSCPDSVWPGADSGQAAPGCRGAGQYVPSGIGGNTSASGDASTRVHGKISGGADNQPRGLRWR